MSIELLECAVAPLGPLLDEVVFVGGASVTLWITRTEGTLTPKAPGLRLTPPRSGVMT